MILKTLHIKNFRSHKNTKLHLHPGVNVITGIGLSGKTPIIDAARWLFFNRPTGNRFKARFNKGGTTKVSAAFTGGPNISLKKRKQSVYTLNGEQFKAFGVNVPEEIQDELNISEINFANQFDQPLLVTSTPTVIRQTINKITGEEAAEDWRASLNKRLTLFKGQLKIAKGELLTARERIKKYKGLSVIGKDIERYKKLNKRVIEKEEKIELLEDIESKSITLSKEISATKHSLGFLTEMKQQLKSIIDKEQKVWETIQTIERALSIEEEQKEEEATLKEEKKKLLALLKRLKRCPTCASPIKTKQLQELQKTF